MNVLLGASPSNRALTSTDLSIHFSVTGLTPQTFATYDKLAAYYNAAKKNGLSDSAIAAGIQSQPDFFLTGDKRSVAYGVLAVAKTIREGTGIADVYADGSTPSWTEAYDMGLGKLTGPWEDIPWGKIALGIGGAILAYGFVTGMGKGLVSK